MRDEAAVAARSFSELRNIIGEIYSILSSTSGRAGDAAALAGLRR
jgi:hypothetical protein